MSHKLFLGVFLLFVLTIESEAKYGCPSIVASRCTTWCKCSSVWNSADYNYRTVFKCDGYSGTIKELGDFIQKFFAGYEVDDFVFNNYKSIRMPSGAFNGTKVNRIIISNSPVLENFGYNGSGKTIFEGLGQHLETLIITNTPNIRVEEWKNLANSLTVGSTNPPALKNLIAYRNSGTTLVPGGLSYFKAFTNLETIVLRSNGLTAFLDSDYLVPDLSLFARLHLLDLSENKLTGFDAELPPGLTIYLNSNRDFVKFGTGFFDKANTTDIGYVNLKDANKLDCDCEKSGISSVVGTELGQRFEGKCATPSQVRGKPYLSTCFSPGYGIIDASNKHLLSCKA